MPYGRTTARSSRSISVVAAALIVLLGGIAALAVSGRFDTAQASTNPHHHGHGHSMPRSEKAVALHSDMRKLWEDHITWTRLAIISLLGDTPDTEATVGRLLQNQADLGNALKPFYGDAAGNQLTALLREHILIAAEVIAAAKAGDQAKLGDAQARWEANADEIAAFLNRANPRFWELQAMKAEMRMHLKLTTDEVVARLQGDWAADVAAYDAVHDHILHMSDLLSSGLIKQFPHRFR
jgi:hypothetical protein